MEDQHQTCGDVALLLWLAAGALQEDEGARVALHVSRCSRCQQLVRENKELAQLYRSTRTQNAWHPSPEEITELAEIPPGERPARARQHLMDCSECRQILSVLEKVQGQGHAGPRLRETIEEQARNLSRWWSTMGGVLPAWLRSPVPAYLMILLLAYPAYLGLTGWSDRGGDLGAPALLTAPVALDSEAQRGPATARFALGRIGKHTVVTFFVPVTGEGHRYEVELKRGSERIFLETDARSFDGIGTFALLLPQESLTPGEYELRVEERERVADPQSKPALVKSFRFSVAAESFQGTSSLFFPLQRQDQQ